MKNEFLFVSHRKIFKHVDSSFELTLWQNSHGELQWKYQAAVVWAKNQLAIMSYYEHTRFSSSLILTTVLA